MLDMMNEVFFDAGEPSGDRLGAALIQGLDRRLSYPADFIGVGGTKMMGMDLRAYFYGRNINNGSREIYRATFS